MFIITLVTQDKIKWYLDSLVTTLANVSLDFEY